MSSPNCNRFELYTHYSFEQNFDESGYNSHENFYDETYDEYSSLSESSFCYNNYNSNFCINKPLLSCNDSKNYLDINLCNIFYEESNVEVFFFILIYKIKMN